MLHGYNIVYHKFWNIMTFGILNYQNYLIKQAYRKIYESEISRSMGYFKKYAIQNYLQYLEVGGMRVTSQIFHLGPFFLEELYTRTTNQ